jgi:hypothetical protein
MPNALPEPLLWNAVVGVAVTSDEKADVVAPPAARVEECIPNALPELLPWNIGKVVADEAAGVHCLLKDELMNPAPVPVC